MQKGLLLLASLFLMSACSSDSPSQRSFKSSDAVDTLNIEYKEFDDCADTSQPMLCNLNSSVTVSLANGLGPSQSLTMPELLDYGVGNCGHYASLLEAELEHLGISHERLSAFGTNGGIHAFTEVRHQGKTYVLDPTLGIYYDSSFLAMVKEPELSTQHSYAIAAGFWSFGGLGLYESVDFFVFNDPTQYTLADINVDAGVIVSGKNIEITVTDPSVDFVMLNFDEPLEIEHVSGYQFNYLFSLSQGTLGLNIPVKTNQPIRLKFTKDISQLHSSNQLRIVGKAVDDQSR